ncbi:MAG TPA: SMP-30/gluconolactonase/LRE family protein, partial [Candidatus Limnocylindrales bacterium]|nr:SMP-30/gluconolactonase/LRE family protein [Candidatus Limnocylindrales bacterium]
MSGDASAPRAELVLDARATLGEGPVWDPDRRLLWWVDILGGVVHGFDPATGGDRAIAIREAVGAIALRASGGLIVAAAGRIAGLDPETGRLETLVAFEVETPPRRSNDAKCDPTGALWLGRMALDGAAGLGALLRLDPDLRLTIVETGLAVPNGMAWSTDGRRMYFIDSMRRQITERGFDAATRMVEPGRPLVEFPADAG